MEKDKGVVVQPPWKVMLILENYPQYDRSEGKQLDFLHWKKPINVVELPHIQVYI